MNTMMNMTSVLAMALSLAACGKAATSGSAASRTANTTANAPATTAAMPSTGDAAILAAAEPFEALTETAFSAAPAALDTTIAEVRAAAATVRGRLAADLATQLDARLAAIGAARASDDRAGLAIAAVEGYRVLVSGVSPGAKVPTEVNLLDYAGFRYDADLKAKPARWDDMKQSVAFGREQWAAIAPRVTDAGLAGKMDASLTEMGKAVGARDAKAAAAVAQRELALVDDLETFFKAN